MEQLVNLLQILDSRVAAPPPLPPSRSCTIKDPANSLTTEDDKSKKPPSSGNHPRAPRPPPRSHALFAEHQLHKLALLCLKWTNAKIPLYSSGFGPNVCSAPTITPEEILSVCSSWFLYDWVQDVSRTLLGIRMISWLSSSHASSTPRRIISRFYWSLIGTGCF